MGKEQENKLTKLTFWRKFPKGEERTELKMISDTAFDFILVGAKEKKTQLNLPIAT